MSRTTSIEIVHTLPDIAELSTAMLHEQIPIFQVHESAVPILGTLAIVETLEGTVTDRFGRPFQFNNYTNHTDNASITFGPHFDDGYSAIAVQRNIVGNPTVQAAFRGNFTNYPLDDDDGEDLHQHQTLASTSGIKLPIYEGETAPGLFTIFAEEVVKRSLLQKLQNRPGTEVLQPAVHKFDRRNDVHGAWDRLTYIDPSRSDKNDKKRIAKTGPLLRQQFIDRAM